MSLFHPPRATLQTAPPPDAPFDFVHRLEAKRNPADDWDDREPDADSGERFDPDALDEEEPQPEPGDFWFEIDDDD